MSCVAGLHTWTSQTDRPWPPMAGQLCDCGLVRNENILAAAHPNIDASEIESLRAEVAQLRHDLVYWQGLELMHEETQARLAAVTAEQTASIIKALTNVGADSTCGACMEQAFTGVTTNVHTCSMVESVSRLKERISRLTVVIAERDQCRSNLSALTAALEAIYADPYGCPFCDSGVLRNPAKGHMEDCGFALTEQVLGQKRLAALRTQ